MEADISGAAEPADLTLSDLTIGDVSDITISASTISSDSGHRSSCDTSRSSIDTVRIAVAERLPLTPQKQDAETSFDSPRSFFSQVRFASAQSIRSLGSFASRRRVSVDPSPTRQRPPLPSFATSVLPRERKLNRSGSRVVARDRLKARDQAHAEAEEKERVLMDELERVGAVRPRRMAKLRAKGLLR